MPDLFDWQPYNGTPGFKTGGTSEDAANAIKTRVAYLRRKCKAALQERDLTADECAAALGETVLSIRPRFSEMRRDGEIMDTKTRRKNASGRSANVWTLV